MCPRGMPDMQISPAIIARALVLWALVYSACVVAALILGVPQTLTFRIALGITCVLVLVVGTQSRPSR